MKKVVIAICAIAGLTLTSCSAAPAPAYGGHCKEIYGVNSALYNIANWLVLSGGYDEMSSNDRAWLLFQAGYPTADDYNSANDNYVKVLRRVRDDKAITLEEKTEIVLFLGALMKYEEIYWYMPQSDVSEVLKDFSAKKAAIAERCIAEESRVSN